MTKKPFTPTADPLTPLERVDQQTYGVVADIPESGSVLARRLPIRSVYPDLRQPRRVIPRSVRGEWDGDPDDFAEVLGNWHAMVEEKLGRKIDLAALLSGKQDADLGDSADPVIAEFMEAVKLARTIYIDGQREAIEVYRAGSIFMIQDGERRWVAHHLLSLHVSGDFSTILAVEKPRNVWAQATRNGAHRPLNAISMARQLALLVMEMYQNDRDVGFDKFEEMVLPGDIDRRYYAQVARGDLYPIKKGMLDRVLDVTGLKSKNQVSQYRALLAVDDALWDKADAENWTENAIRELMQADRTRAEGDRYTTVTHIFENMPVSTGAINAAVGLADGDLVITPEGLVREVYEVGIEEHEWVVEVVDLDGKYFGFMPGALVRIDESTVLTVQQYADVVAFKKRQMETPPLGSPSTDDPMAGDDSPATSAKGRDGVEFTVGDHVRTPAGHVGKVYGISASGKTVYVEGAQGQSSTHVVKVEAASGGLTTSPLADAEKNVAAMSSRFPRESYVVNCKTGELGKVVAYGGAENALVIADPLLPETQDVFLWLVDAARLATNNEVTIAFGNVPLKHDFRVGERVRVVGNPVIGEVYDITTEKVGIHRSDGHGGTMTHWVTPEKVNRVPQEFKIGETVIVTLKGVAIEGEILTIVRDEACVNFPSPSDPQVKLSRWIKLEQLTHAPAAASTDDENDEDEDETADGTASLREAPGDARGTTAAALAAGASHDTTAPLLAAWKNPQLGEILMMLRYLTSDGEQQERDQINALLTLSEDDLRARLARQPAASYLGVGDWLTAMDKQIVRLVERAITNALHDYTGHLRGISAKLDAERHK